MVICEGQISLFNTGRYKIRKPIRLIELFAGIGAQAASLRNLGVDFEHWKVVEWDKYAMKSYNAVHSTNFETSDICDTHASDLEIVDRDDYVYIMTYSFPCQDLSVAGKGAGMKKGSGTRSGLLWEVERLLDECEGNLPQVLLMENVPQIHNKHNLEDFNQWQAKLTELGYRNWWADLNAKDYGVPQNRNRTFMVSLLDGEYEFPKKIPLTVALKDYLEEVVDEKYYLSQKGVEGKIRTNYHTYGFKRNLRPKEGVAATIECSVARAPQCVAETQEDYDEVQRRLNEKQTDHR